MIKVRFFFAVSLKVILNNGFGCQQLKICLKHVLHSFCLTAKIANYQPQQDRLGGSFENLTLWLHKLQLHCLRVLQKNYCNVRNCFAFGTTIKPRWLPQAKHKGDFIDLSWSSPAFKIVSGHFAENEDCVQLTNEILLPLQLKNLNRSNCAIILPLDTVCCPTLPFINAGWAGQKFSMPN